MKAARITKWCALAVLGFQLGTPILRADHDKSDTSTRDRISRSRDERNDRNDRNDRSYGASRDQGGLERAHRLIGSPVRFEDQGRGRLEDVVVDLESGRILYGMVAMNPDRNQKSSELYAVPPSLISTAPQGRMLEVKADRSKVQGAPTMAKNASTGWDSPSFASDVYKHYGASPWWSGYSGNGKFGHVHRLSDLFRMPIVNVMDSQIGKVQDAVLDFADARVLYVVLDPDKSLDLGSDLFPVPPNALTMGKNNNLVLDTDKSKLSAGPKFREGNWPNLDDYQFATDVWKHYGKTPYFEGKGTVTPTSDLDRPARRNRRQ